MNLKSGAIALTTDLSKNTYFDNFKILQLNCVQDNFDS